MNYTIEQLVVYLNNDGFGAASLDQVQLHQFFDKKLDDQVTLRVYVPVLKNNHLSVSAGVRMYLFHGILQRYIGETAYYEWTEEADLEEALKIRIELLQDAYFSGQYRSPLDPDGYVFKNGLQPYWICRQTGGILTDEEWKAMQ